jgi:DNA repair protein RadA/Sms
LATKDIYLNVVGGMDLEDPGSDLGVALSIVSSEKDVVIDAFTTIIGEVGLAGEVRPVPNIERLVKEAERNGFKRFVLPEKNYETAKKVADKIEIVPVSKVQEAIKVVLK